jgi:uncharacterized protein (TIGR02466 family)
MATPPPIDPKIHLRWHFAVPIYEKIVDGYGERKAAIARAVLALRDGDAQRIVRSNQGGFHSHEGLHESDDPDLKWLFRSIEAVAARCIDQFEGERPHGGSSIVAAWANVNEQGDWALPHMHLPCDWSGVFYVDAGDDAGDPSARGQVMFMNPLPLGDRWRRANAVTYDPKDGLMLVFPSFLMHMVTPHRLPSPRISIAWNLVIRPAAGAD